MSIDLFGLLPEELDVQLRELGAERYRADQLLNAVYRHGAADIEVIDLLPAALRGRLRELGYTASLDDPVRTVASEDGETTKALLPMESRHPHRDGAHAIWPRTRTAAQHRLRFHTGWLCDGLRLLRDRPDGLRTEP